MIDAPIATCTESECCDARDTFVAIKPTSNVDEPIDVAPSELSGAGTSLSMTSVGIVRDVDKCAVLPRAGSKTTDPILSIDASDDIGGSRVRTLVDFSCWARSLVEAIGVSDTHWTSSTAFSGVGCSELASAALSHAAKRSCFGFLSWDREGPYGTRYASQSRTHCPCTH